MGTKVNNVRGVCSYTFFRHAGGLSPDGVLALVPTYALFAGDGVTAGTAMVFKDDVAAAETPTRAYPPTGGFTSRGMVISNDSVRSIFFSLDGIRDHAEVLAGETLQIDWIHAQQLFLRGQAGAEEFRLWVW